LYAFWGRAPPSCRWVRETYRLRFGIETTYRQLHQARIRTCTRDPLLRLLYVGVALILRNVWVWLHWEVLAWPRRGGRRVELGRLRFRQMLWWLQRLVERWWTPRDLGAAEAPPPTEGADQPRRRTSNY
jgi:putative transposase